MLAKIFNSVEFGKQVYMIVNSKIQDHDIVIFIA